MDFLLGAVSGTLNAMAAVLPGFTFARDLSADIAKITPYIQKANYMLPVDAAMNVLSLFCALQVCMILYYWITRAINLLRGAG